MSQSRADFRARLSRLPKQEIPESYSEYAGPIIGSALAPLFYVISGLVGFINYFALPMLVRSFAENTDTQEDPKLDAAMDAIWALPSIGLAFAGSVVFASLLGWTSGGHFKSAAIGIGLAFAISFFLVG